jgi:chromate transporter
MLLAAISRFIFPSFFQINKNAESKNETDEREYFINKNTVVENTGFNLLRMGKQILTAVLLWTIPVIAFYFLTSDFAFWKRLSVFFTQAAFVTFGGAYAVLPYVAQVSVEKLRWLTHLQMIDGLALGETTPGPLIMVLVFVGFMAGYNHFGNSLAMGAAGLVITTFYTFLPCFLFILAGAPIIEQTQENKKVKEILSLVTAAVVGVVLNLTIYLGKAVVFPKEVSIVGLDYITLGWIAISFAAMYRFNIGMITWIGVSALFGLLYYLTMH